MLDAIKSKAEWARWGILGLLTALFLYINLPFLVPIIIASIFALGLDDFINRLSQKVRRSRGFSIGLTVFAGLAIFWIPLTLAIYRIAMHMSAPPEPGQERLGVQFQHLKELLLNILTKISHTVGTDLAGPARGMMDNVLRRTGEIIFKFSSEILAQLPTILLASFVFLLVLVALLVKASAIRSLLTEYTPFKEETTQRLLEITKSGCESTLFSTLVIGLVQASVVSIGSLIFGEGDFWLVMTATFFVSFIPVIGAAPVGFLLAVMAFVGDRLGAGIGMTIVALIAGSIDNILKPFMVGKDNDVNPMVGFTCVVGAIIMMGLPGLIIGPVIMNLFVGLSPLLLKENTAPVIEIADN
ncbi:MAG: AI-2E family transporter [Bdellovibrio sp.]|nr:AI-2E family transporter [Bdellovibrio sp.]